MIGGGGEALVAHGAAPHAQSGQWTDLLVFALPVVLAAFVISFRGRQDRQRSLVAGSRVPSAYAPTLLTPPAFLTVRTATPEGVGTLEVERPHVAMRASARDLVAHLAVGASLTAAAVHAWVAAQHVPGSWPLAVFFAAAAAAQLGWASASRPWSRRWLQLGVAGNVALMGLWLVSRTVGLPLVPGLGAREPMGTLDVVATGGGLIVVACTVALLRSFTIQATMTAWPRHTNRSATCSAGTAS